MRRVYFFLVSLLLVSVSAAAQQRALQVRLFWQHAPSRIHVVAEGASLRACETCASNVLSNEIDITGHGSNLVAGTISSSALVLSGRARITGDGFSPFEITNELRVQSRHGVLLLTLAMTLEEYVTAVLQGESANFKSDEALKAMAVAAEPMLFVSARGIG